MKALTYSARAQSDIDAIWEYSVERWGIDQAERYVREIKSQCNALAFGHKRGTAANVRPGYLKRPCGSHVIYYRDLPDGLEVIRILHAAQDVERHLHD
jgi:toxin ParE1/3/4